MKTKSISQPVRRPVLRSSSATEGGSLGEGASAPAQPPAREEFRSSPSTRHSPAIAERRLISEGGPCRAVAFSEGGFFNLRVSIALAILFGGVFLALFVAAMRPPGPVTQAWVARYNGPANGLDDAKAIAVDGSGNVYVTGFSLGAGTFNDYATIKYDSAGQEQWVARLPLSDRATAIAVDSSGNVYVTGRGWCCPGTLPDYTTVKYDSAGLEQWVAHYNGPGNGQDEAYAIAIDGSGNVYVTGDSPAANLAPDYATIKYDSNGQEQWVARYNGPGDWVDQANAIAIDSSGNVYVTGESDGTNSVRDYATIKYNSAGQEQWVARYNGTGNFNDAALAIAIDSSGNLYVTGSSDGTRSSDYATVKYDSAGQEQWVARYNGPTRRYDDAEGIVVDGSGNVYVTGASVGRNTGFDYATIKYVQNPP